MCVCIDICICMYVWICILVVMCILSLNFFSNPNVTQEMGGWGMRFASRLLELKGHILKQEAVFMRGRQV